MSEKKFELKGRTGARFLHFAMPKRKSMLMGRKDDVEYVRVGSRFERKSTNETVETVKVTGFSRDASGIPHVRYNLHRGHIFSTLSDYDNARSLSVSAFRKLFGRRVD